MATSITVLIIAPCIIFKSDVFSHCWCLHLSISREPLFTKTDQHTSPGWVTLCKFRERHITPVDTVNTPFLQHGKCQGLYLCSWPSSGHIPRTNMSMLSIGPVLNRSLDNNSPSSQSGWKNVILLSILAVMHPHGFLTVCGARRGECSLGMASFQLCKIGLVLKGVHQWFSGNLSAIAASTEIPTCRCWTLEADQAFTKDKWSFTQA